MISKFTFLSTFVTINLLVSFSAQAVEACNWIEKREIMPPKTFTHPGTGGTERYYREMEWCNNRYPGAHSHGVGSDQQIAWFKCRDSVISRNNRTINANLGQPFNEVITTRRCDPLPQVDPKTVNDDPMNALTR